MAHESLSSKDVDFAAYRACVASVSTEIQPEKLWELFCNTLSFRERLKSHKFFAITDDDVSRELDTLFIAAEQSRTSLQHVRLIFERRYKLLLYESRKITNGLRHLQASTKILAATYKRLLIDALSTNVLSIEFKWQQMTTDTDS